MDLYSTGLTPYEDSITNSFLQSTLAELQALIGGKELILLKWDEERIAIPILIPIVLPTLGNTKGLDIGAYEPIIIVFQVNKYPWKAPLVFPDRLDFPRDLLSHLYISFGPKPPAICLSRDGADEWYANKTICDLLIRVQNWYRDAAAGVLNEDGDQFEPFRLTYSGTFIYDYDIVAQLAQNSFTNVTGSNFSLLLLEYFNGVDGDFGWKFVKSVTDSNFMEIDTQVQFEINKSVDDKSRKLLFYGVVVWSEAGTIIDHYKIEIPRTWQEFVKFCLTYDILLDKLESYITSFNHHKFKAFPIIVAINRPKPIIGYNSSLELLNFSLYIDDHQKTDKSIDNDATVSLRQHRQPLTHKKAGDISGFTGNIPALSIVAGIGALGARVCGHLVKSGAKMLFVSDPDKLSPHNFVRHPLSSKFNNLTKANAFSIEMNTAIPDAEIKASGLIANELIDILSKHGTGLNILDFTASETFQNFLINHNGISDSSICSATISDFGNLGITYFEGDNRNPRLDDLQILLFNEARKNKRIAEWMTRENEISVKGENINIGVGCNSETTVLSEDIVAAHASFVSGNIKLQSLITKAKPGRVFVNSVNMVPYYHFNTFSFEYSPLEIISVENDSAWQVRIVKTVVEKIKTLTSQADPRETGGVMIGRANYKTKTVHIIDVIDAPPDSIATKTCFYRGKKGLPEQIESISKVTGSQIGYIGDWHSHPKGPNCASKKDIDTLTKLRQEYDTLPNKFPAFILISTPEKLISYLM